MPRRFALAREAGALWFFRGRVVAVGDAELAEQFLVADLVHGPRRRPRQFPDFFGNDAVELGEDAVGPVADLVLTAVLASRRKGTRPDGKGVICYRGRGRLDRDLLDLWRRGFDELADFLLRT